MSLLKLKESQIYGLAAHAGASNPGPVTGQLPIQVANISV